MKRLATVTGLLGVAAMVFALSSFNRTFNETYKVGASSKLGKAACMVCHTGARGGALNAYGSDVKGAMKKGGVHKVTTDVLKAVEGMDSDKDGMSNVDEIKKDRNPGVSG